MKISVKVKPNSRQIKIEKTGDNEFLLWVRAPAKEGKANAAVIELLSEYFNIPKSRISIIKGHNNSNKVIDLI